MTYLTYSPHDYKLMPADNEAGTFDADSKEPGWSPDDGYYYLGSRGLREARQGWYSIDDYFMDRGGHWWYHTRYFTIQHGRKVFHQSSVFLFGRLIPAWERMKNDN